MRKKKESKYSGCSVLTSKKKKNDRMQSLDKILSNNLTKTGGFDGKY